VREIVFAIGRGSSFQELLSLAKKANFDPRLFAIEVGRENSFPLTRTGSEEPIAAVLGAKK
jgi:hypothetical protein